MDPEQQVGIPQTPPQPQGMGMPAPTGAPESGAQMATGEQRQQLLDLIGATMDKLGDVNTARFSAENSAALNKSDALKEIFSIMQRAGVDLTDLQSVSEFLNGLREQNPEMAEFFEQNLNQLLGGEPITPETGVTDPIATTDQSASMNNNETIPENVRGYMSPNEESSTLG